VPRAGLNEARVIEEAERLVDEVGLERLTLAALAERLGVRQPSLYKHIEGMDGLQRSLTMRAISEMGEMLARAAVGRERDAAIVAMSNAYRAWAMEHPGRYAAGQRPPVAGDEEELEGRRVFVEVVADVLAGYDLSGDDAIDATRILRASLHGFVTLEAGGGFGLPVDIDDSFEQLVGVITAGLSNWPSAKRSKRSRA
jgi:AcrR family transcriptional regulator